MQTPLLDSLIAAGEKYVTVYHLNADRVGRQERLRAQVDGDTRSAAHLYQTGGYDLVACYTEELDDDLELLERAWFVTQNGASSWVDLAKEFSEFNLRPYVIGARSSMVGDVFRVSNGRTFVCCSVGFLEIEA